MELKTPNMDEQSNILNSCDSPSDIMPRILDILRQKIELGDLWITKCNETKNRIRGIEKLVRKMEAELTFLKNLRKCQSVKPDQVNSSNLVHLQAIAHTALTARPVTSVLQPMPISDGSVDSRTRNIVVDIITDDGYVWIKVVARNPKALNQISMGDGHFGEKTILDHAVDYVRCSKQNPNYYVVPSVHFFFYKGISEALSNRLERENVLVQSFSEDTLLSPNSFCIREQLAGNDILCKPRVTLLNLDVSCMIAYVSSLTNGKCNLVFKEGILTEQASRERQNPIKPTIDKWFACCKLVSCETAVCDFNKIIDIIGGDNEKLRAHDLLERVAVVKDLVSPKIAALRLGGQIKNRSLVIFGTGESMQAVTVTANVGFVRSAESQGVSLAVFVHESRALTESKEKTATEL